MSKGQNHKVAFKPKNVGTTIKRILQYIKAYWLQLILVILLVLISSVASISEHIC